jgi:hypothetical protein
VIKNHTWILSPYNWRRLWETLTKSFLEKIKINNGNLRAGFGYSAKGRRAGRCYNSGVHHEKGYTGGKGSHVPKSTTKEACCQKIQYWADPSNPGIQEHTRGGSTHWGAKKALKDAT